MAALLIFSSGMIRKGVIPVRVISTNGKVEPVKNFEAHAPAPATVKHVSVKPADQVKAGQLLLQLDDAEARSSAARALALLRAAEADLHTGLQSDALHGVQITNVDKAAQTLDPGTTSKTLDGETFILVS